MGEIQTNKARVSPLLAVRDLDASIRFYGLFGFEPIVRWETYARLACGESNLHLAVEGDAPPDRPNLPMVAPDGTSHGSPSLLVMEVADCQSVSDHIRANGFELLGDPAVPPWGGEVRAFVLDPDGHLVEINQPTGPATTH